MSDKADRLGNRRKGTNSNDVSSGELAALIAVVFVIVYSLPSARWWWSARPRGPVV